MIPVTQPYLPPIEDYQLLLNNLWKSKWVTNNGELSQKLESDLTNFLGVNSLHYVTNGTIALQIALKALDIEGDVLTTPFSFIATSSSILWEKCNPIYVDIRPDTLNIDETKIEQLITNKTKAILATHVFGIPCNVEEIKRIAKRNNLFVIYDAAHAFGVTYKDKSLVSYGDISTLSFHATKLFHTIEGGAIINNCRGIDNKIESIRNFGIDKRTGQIDYIGINGKNSEFHAAIGLCLLNQIDSLISERKLLTNMYDSELNQYISKPYIPKDTLYNYAYYPVIFKNQKQTEEVLNILNSNQISARRYFNPSLNELVFLDNKYKCRNSEDLSNRILCLPLYNGLEVNVLKKIIMLITKKLS
ncbi:aminotransferase DegT [Bacillus coahuilensis p1.1.43]|uniref:Aminotransferase DegT n=1 Tax=Bacillus coahuilensis p1.1.43 TaxID=1150625 RepID=A0A147K604_9BACI|nr:DegT/DnrJ/EryC1/StrS family aminotransferase [Bacillus coahuilensis]KUP05257.1 aminotransferase DegT [Bacillus coahuilensis p1.1.43]